MPHIPDLRAHDAHDLELVAAFAAGDAAGTDLETATALVAGCAECAALHHDLRAIAAALPALPAPVRRRDFRLTPEQAGSLRPAGWRRLLGTLAGPSFRFAAPLGTGLATLGLVGILAGSLASVPLGAGGTTAGREQGDPSYMVQASGAPAQGPSAVPSVVAEMPIRTMSGNDPLPLASPNEEYAGQASPDTDTAAGEGPGASAGAAGGGVADPVTDATGPGAGGDAGTQAPSDDAVSAARERSAGELLGIVGAAALLVGLALLALRWTSRRLA